MVLQVGAVRHKLPPALGDDKRRPARRRADRPRRAHRDAPPARRDARARTRTPSSCPSPASATSTRSLDKVRRAGLPVELHVEGDPSDAARGPSTSPPTGSSRRASPTPSSTPTPARPTSPSAPATTASEIEVRDDGAGGARTATASGHGLVGVRERVKIYGGEMSCGQAPGGRLRPPRAPPGRRDRP